MAKWKEEKTPEAVAAPVVTQKIVAVAESEKLQSEGWHVVGMTKKDGVRVHILEKG